MNQSNEYIFYIFNVQQGDSLLLEFPGNKFGVIDCKYHESQNPKEDDPPVLAYLKERKVKNLEFICLSHPHLDHCHGLWKVCQYFSDEGRTFKYLILQQIDLSLIAKSYSKSSTAHYEFNMLYNYSQKLAMDNFEKRKPCNDFRFKLLSDDLRRIQFLDFKDINIIVFGPPNETVMKAQKLLQDNNKTKFKSIINRISMAWFLFFFNNEIKVLLSGDTENYIWKRMFQFFNDKKYTGNLKCDLIKIAHHGSEYSYSDDLFKKIAYDKSENKKSKVIISTGGTSHHPGENVLKSILEKNTDLYCTNKGPICRNLKDHLSKIKTKSEKDLSNLFQIRKKKREKQIKVYRRMKEKLNLKSKRNECSGDMVFKISQSKKAEIFHQERPVECFYKKQKLIFS